MKYDHRVNAADNLQEERFHLSCGFYETTSFFFEKGNFSVDIHCKGMFTFRTAAGEALKTVKAKPMTSGRGCYVDVLITTAEDSVIFKLPDYEWTDHYPYCDGESDRWDAKIIGVNDEVRYSLSE